jgi:AraC-like DNA-binding protein
MRYAEYGPSPHLALFVETYWLLEGASSSAAADAILPDGRIELVFHYSGSFWRHRDGVDPVRQPQALLAGQMIEPVVLSPQGHAGVAAIRLRPAAARSILGFASSEVTGRFVDLSLVFASADGLIERLAEAATDARRVALLEEWLVDRACRPPLVNVHGAVDTILATCGRATVSMLAAQAGTSVRQMERQFQAEVGLTPKTFARIIRLQAALRRVRQDRPLDDIALSCGFFDQAHMSRDFRQLAATSPAAWRAHVGDLAGLFVG